MAWYREMWGFVLLIGFILFIFAIIIFEFGDKAHPSLTFWLLMLGVFSMIVLSIALYAYQVQLPKDL